MHPWFEKFLTYLKAEKNSSPHTLIGYTHDLREFFRFLGEAPVETAEKDRLRGDLAFLKEANLSKRTIARRTACLRTFFRFVRREGFRPDSPMAGLRSQKLEKKLPLVLDETEDERLLESPEDDLD